MVEIRKFNPSGLTTVKDPKYEQIIQKWSQYGDFHLEIGAGVGWHPIQFAKENPDSLMVAVERTKEKFASFQRRINNHQLVNLVAVHADVVPWLWFFNHDYTFDKVWLLYPNPEPKNKNQRWINSPFFAHLRERLSPRGEIEFATNISSYADEIVENSFEKWGMSCHREIYLGSPRTHFEKKYSDRISLILRK